MRFKFGIVHSDLIISSCSVLQVFAPGGRYSLVFPPPRSMFRPEPNIPQKSDVNLRRTYTC